MIIALSFNPLTAWSKHILCGTGHQQCIQNIQNYPLFDTKYKIAANYIPILAPRAFAHAEIYKEKKKCKLERLYYIKNLEGQFSEPYQTTILNIEVKNHGLFGRKIVATGKLNDFNLEYENIVGASLPRNAAMKVKASIEGIEILDLKIKSDGNAQTNEVQGSFFAKEVNYLTKWRDSNGCLANIDYKVHTEGLDIETDNFKVVTRGSIGNHEIFGHGNMPKPNYYEFEEHYGPILVKSKLWILN